MLTLKDIEDKLRAAGAPVTAGDHTLNPGMTPAPTLRKAAVLILLVEKPDGIHILFTERTAHLTTHAGQISFPGGGAEKADKDIEHTALREAQEEIGLDPANVRVIGRLGDYITRSGFLVTPVIAALEKDQQWFPDENEVARIFDAPLEHVLSPGALRQESVTFEGRERRFFVMDWRSFRIWGATAGILKNFADVLACQGPANDTHAPQKKDGGGPKNN